MRYNLNLFLLPAVLVFSASCSTMQNREPALLDDQQQYAGQHMEDEGQPPVSTYEFGVELIGPGEVMIRLPFYIDNVPLERYELYRYVSHGESREGGPGELLESGPGGQLSVIDSGLAESVTYCYVLVAYDDEGKRFDKTLEECQYTHAMPEPRDTDSGPSGRKVLKGMGKAIAAIAYLAITIVPLLLLF